MLLRGDLTLLHFLLVQVRRVNLFGRLFRRSRSDTCGTIHSAYSARVAGIRVAIYSARWWHRAGVTADGTHARHHCIHRADSTSCRSWRAHRVSISRTADRAGTVLRQVWVNRCRVHQHCLMRCRSTTWWRWLGAPHHRKLSNSWWLLRAHRWRGLDGSVNNGFVALGPWHLRSVRLDSLGNPEETT